MPRTKARLKAKPRTGKTAPNITPKQLSRLPATSATIAGRIRAAPIPSRSDHPMMRTVRFGASAVVSDPAP
jgi:hypothetical protein